MKKLLLSLFLVTPALAATFTTSENLTIKNGTYSLPQTISVVVLNLDKNSNTAKIKIGNTIGEYIVKFISTEREDYEISSIYTAQIGKRVFADGFGCDEAEEIHFIVNFTLEDELRDPHSPRYFRTNSLTASYSYTDDICHSSRSIKNIKYQR
jgi:hypothetical protein